MMLPVHNNHNGLGLMPKSGTSGESTINLMPVSPAWPKEGGMMAAPMQRPPQRSSTWPGGKMYWLKWLILTVCVSVLIAAPMIGLRSSLEFTGDTLTEQIESIYRDQWRNLGFWICGWLLVSWFSGCLFHAFAQFFPSIFKVVASYINPAHRRYWRAFRFMKWPITVLGATICSYVSYALMIEFNEELAANYDFNSFTEALSEFSGNATVSEDGTLTLNGHVVNDSGKETLMVVQTVLDNVLFNLILWASLYFLLKCMILYITIHYNTRSNSGKLENIKRVMSSLVQLYNASISLSPTQKREFLNEDVVIHETLVPRQGPLNIKEKAGRTFTSGVNHLSSAFGYLANSNEESHWWEPGSSYAVVARAMDHPTVSAALAKRIWISLVSEGRDVLEVEDLVAALGPYRLEEAHSAFALLDENENGNIRLTEFVGTVVETGKLRRNIYAGLHDINHAINTFDWVLLFILAVAMVSFILISWVPQIAELRQNLSLIVVGAAFIVGRIGHEFFAGAIFLFFKHAFDVSDTVKLWNLADTTHVVCTVKRMSLLYVIFERVDDGTEFLVSNDRLCLIRIENLSRSAPNREQIDLGIDFDTSFQDIQYLREELSRFVAREDNRRDYHPQLDVRIKAIPDLQKIQLQCRFWHKSNWSNDDLRAARSSKFMCELLRLVRKTPISKPGGSKAKTGDEGKPSYIVHISEEAAAAKRQAETKKQADKRFDTDKETGKPIEKEKAALNETAALEQLSIIPRVEVRHGSAATGMALDEGLRHRGSYISISGSETGLRTQGGSHEVNWHFRGPPNPASGNVSADGGTAGVPMSQAK